MDNLANALGILGAYFVVLLVLAVAVETILEPFTLFKGLRKKVNPDEFTTDLKEWISSSSEATHTVKAITKFAKQINVGAKDIQSFVSEIASSAETTSGNLGSNGANVSKELLNVIYKYQYTLGEKKRIVFLRILSAIIGVVIAKGLQLDSFTMLSNLLPKGTTDIFLTQGGHYGGILLTGLAASAGSSFWHDQLAKVRAVKEVAGKIK